MINIITAMDKNNLIGAGNSLPWHLPEDLKYFKKKTVNNIVVMGRKTFESIGKPLPNRDNLILTRYGTNVGIFNRTWITDFDEVIKLSSKYKDKDFFIIGGAEIYSLFLPYVEKLYITRINHKFTGNIYFPEIDWSEWCKIESTKGIKNEINPFDYFFEVYRRI